MRALLLMALLQMGTAAAAPPSNTLTWKVTEGHGIFGYIIYRSEQRQGPFLRANAKILRRGKAESAGETLGQYQFVDTDVLPGHTYYYFIDVVDVSGFKQRLSGVQKHTVSDS